MNKTMKISQSDAASRRWLRYLTFAAVGGMPLAARASMFQGEALDKVADVMTWVVLVIAPVVAIGVFLIIHILPEKIAEKKQHPQTSAIQCLCLLSLFFGGLLWPLAWLWAYSKPVMYKLAYGTDKVPHGDVVATVPESPALEHSDQKGQTPARLVAKEDGTGIVQDEVIQLRKRIAELESKLAGEPVQVKKV